MSERNSSRTPIRSKMGTNLKMSAAVGVLAFALSPSAWAQEAASAPVAPATPASVAPATTDNGGLTDIVVTATRRSEAANKIPLAIRALGGEALRDLHVSNLEDLVAQMSNVRSASRGPGVSSIYIRGLSSDTPGAQFMGTVGVQPNVALYLNDAPSSMPGRNLDIYPVDLNRVEVLAGPQGTLFGASSMGGAIRYITSKPDLTRWGGGINGSVSATYSAAMSGEVDGYINIPIVKDKLALRVTGYFDHQGGYIDNVYGEYQMPFDGHVGEAGQLPTGNPLLVSRALTSCVGVTNCTGSGYTPPIRQKINNAAYVKNNYNDAEYKGFRAALTYQIDPDWSIDVMHMRQKLTSDGVFDYQPDIGDLKVHKFGPNTLKDNFDVTTLNINGRIGALTVLYAGSYVHHEAQQTADYSGYSNVGLYLPYYECDAGVYYNSMSNAGNTCYTPGKSYRIKSVNKRLTNELRIVSPADKRIRGTLGVFYDVNKLRDNTDWLYSQAAAGYIYPRSVNPSLSANDYGVKPTEVTFFNDTYRLDKQFAVYGEVSIDIIPHHLTLTGGARYYRETASMTGSSDGSFGGARGVYDPATGTYSAAANPPAYYNISADLSQTLAGLSPAHYNGVIPKANLTYKFDNGSLIYATYSEGFRPGGFNRRPCRTNTPECVSLRYYRPDHVNNYEVGWKLSALNHRLQFNVAAYIIRWTNVQMSVFDQNISNQTFTNNLLNARIHGIEGDLAWRATRELTVNSSFSYNDSKVTDYVLPISALVPLGSPLAMSPKFQFSVTGRYQRELANGFKPFIQASVRHVSSSISSDVANTSIRWTGSTVTYNGVTVNNGDPISPQITSLKQGGYEMLDISLGVSRDKWTFEVYGKNLTNARPELFRSLTEGEYRTTTARPLTVGLRGSYNF